MKIIAKTILALIAMAGIGFLFNEDSEGILLFVEKFSAIAVLAGCAKAYLALDKNNKKDYSNEAM